MKVKKEWHKDFFKNSFYNPASPISIKRAPSEVNFILRQLKLKKKSKILDVCCGPARHSLVLAKKGFIVTGYDFSKEYLKEAELKAKKLKLNINLVCGDMRKLKFKNEFDAALNLFTSFGYFQKFSDDMKVLKCVSNALKPKGLFMIDIIHGEYVKNNFREKNWQLLEDNTYHLEEVQPFKDGLINSWTRIDKKGKTQKNSFFTRLYTKKNLNSALKKTGFKPLKFWGSFKGEKLTNQTNRLIVLAKKQ